VRVVGPFAGKGQPLPGTPAAPSLLFLPRESEHPNPNLKLFGNL
jgi:hypothetical protein